MFPPAGYLPVSPMSFLFSYDFLFIAMRVKSFKILAVIYYHNSNDSIE